MGPTPTHLRRRHGRTFIAAILIAVLLGVIAFVFMSRGRTPTQQTASPEPPLIGVLPATAPAIAINQEHIVPGRQIGPVSLGMTQDEVKAALGAPDVTLNKMWEWKDPQMSVGFGPDAQVVVILAGGVGVTPKRVPFRTIEGIAIGATAELVIAAWGEPDSDQTEKGPQGVSRRVNYASRGIQMLFYDGKLTWLSVRAASPATRPAK
jgi:hypothetical protein